MSDLLARTALGQVSESLAGESAAEAAKRAREPKYDLRYGPIRYQVEGAMGVELNDNIAYANSNRQEDIILRPEVKLRAYWPVSQLNSLSFSMGAGYAYYVKNTALNSGLPLISPDSQLEFKLYSGDFRFNLHERFYYQEDLLLSAAYANVPGQLYNLNNVARFRRFDNLAGVTADWDLNKLILTFNFDHEDFLVSTPQFDYLTRSSELFSTAATFSRSPTLKFGIEDRDNLHQYEKHVLVDNLDSRLGPFLHVALNPGLAFRVGGGYETALYRHGGVPDVSTYYAYGLLRHQATTWFSHTLAAGRENQLGLNANALISTYARHEMTFTPILHTDISLYWGVSYGHEFGGSYSEKFYYYTGGLSVSHRLGKRWLASVRYDFLEKASQTSYLSLHQNRLGFRVAYTL